MLHIFEKSPRPARYLFRRRGHYGFQIRVPKPLQILVGCQVIKRSLKTQDPAEAQRRALTYWLWYSQIFNALKKGKGLGRREDDDELRALGIDPDSIQELTTHITPTGIQVTKDPGDSMDDYLAAVLALKAHIPNFPSASPTPAAPTVSQPLALWDAAQRFRLELTAKHPGEDKKQNTLFRPVQALLDWLKAKHPGMLVHELTRSHFSAFYTELGTRKIQPLSPPTRQNYQGRIVTFLEYCQSLGAVDLSKDNPASGHVKYTDKDKQKRTLKQGARAFSPAELATIFHPHNARIMKPDLRWAVLLDLLTGARASEVGQLLTHDLAEVSPGDWSVHIKAEGAGQSLKNEPSQRTIPLHPLARDLGLADLLADARERPVRETDPGGRARRVFKRSNNKTQNGAGAWISKAFSRYLVTIGIKDPDETESEGRLSTHSFRDTIYQACQNRPGGGVDEAMIEAFVGHHYDSASAGRQAARAKGAQVRHAYAGKPQLKAMADEIFPAIDAMLPYDIETMREWLTTEHKTLPKHGPKWKPVTVPEFPEERTE